MKPATSATPWDSIRGLVNVVVVIAGLLVGITLLSLIPSSGFSTGDGLDDQMCVTVSRGDALYDDESTFERTSRDGVTSSETGRAYCKPYDKFEDPYAARFLAQIGYAPIEIAVLGLMLGLRRIIKQTWDEGPFNVDAVRLLDRFRWWAAGAVAVALAAQWLIKGLKLQMLTDKPWPHLGVPWTVILVWVAATVITTHCENVARRGGDGPDDDGRV